MSHYRKLIAAVVGLGLLLLNRHVGLDLTDQEQTLVDMIIAGGTAFGVFQAKND